MDEVTTAVPASWLTSADVTSGSASSAFFTVASQCPHIIPSICIVFVIFVSSLSLIFISVGFAAGTAFLFAFPCTENRFSRNALVTTQKLDKLMAAAPNIGFNFHPNIGYHTPAASGIPITL